jgi:hypothetical protein
MMNSLYGLIHSLAEDGISLDVSENGIVCRGDRDRVIKRLAEIKPHKPELLRILTGKPTDNPYTIGLDEMKYWISRGYRARFHHWPDGRQTMTWLEP